MLAETALDHRSAASRQRFNRAAAFLAASEGAAPSGRHSVNGKGGAHARGGAAVGWARGRVGGVVKLSLRAAFATKGSARRIPKSGVLSYPRAAPTVSAAAASGPRKSVLFRTSSADRREGAQKVEAEEKEGEGAGAMAAARAAATASRGILRARRAPSAFEAGVSSLLPRATALRGMAAAASTSDSEGIWAADEADVVLSRLEQPYRQPLRFDLAEPQPPGFGAGPAGTSEPTPPRGAAAAAAQPPKVKRTRIVRTTIHYVRNRRVSGATDLSALSREESVISADDSVFTTASVVSRREVRHVQYVSVSGRRRAPGPGTVPGAGDDAAVVLSDAGSAASSRAVARRSAVRKLVVTTMTRRPQSAATLFGGSCGAGPAAGGVAQSRSWRSLAGLVASGPSGWRAVAGTSAAGAACTGEARVTALSSGASGRRLVSAPGAPSGRRAVLRPAAEAPPLLPGSQKGAQPEAAAAAAATPPPLMKSGRHSTLPHASSSPDVQGSGQQGQRSELGGSGLLSPGGGVVAGRGGRHLGRHHASSVAGGTAGPLVAPSASRSGRRRSTVGAPPASPAPARPNKGLPLAALRIQSFGREASRLEEAERDSPGAQSSPQRSTAGGALSALCHASVDRGGRPPPLVLTASSSSAAFTEQRESLPPATARRPLTRALSGRSAVSLSPTATLGAQSGRHHLSTADLAARPSHAGARAAVFDPWERKAVDAPLTAESLVITALFTAYSYVSHSLSVQELARRQRATSEMFHGVPGTEGLSFDKLVRETALDGELSRGGSGALLATRGSPAPGQDGQAAHTVLPPLLVSAL